MRARMVIFVRPLARRGREIAQPSGTYSMALACVNIPAPLAINALSDDGWRLSPGRPLYACDLPVGPRQHRECVLIGPTVAGRFALDTLQLNPHRFPLRSRPRHRQSV